MARQTARWNVNAFQPRSLSQRVTAAPETGLAGEGNEFLGTLRPALAARRTPR